MAVGACGGDVTTHGHDGGAGLDLGARDLGASDLGPLVIPGCDPVSGSSYSFDTVPTPAVAPGALLVEVNGPDPLANITVTLRSASGRVLAPGWLGVDLHYRWQWNIAATYPGDYCVTVTADPSAMVYYRGTLRIGGSDPGDAGPPDAGLPPTGTFITRSGTELMAGSERFRFIGMNLRGLAHYGTPLLMYASTAQIDTQLDEVQRMGARAIRVFAAANDTDAGTVAARLDRVLDAARARGIWVIVVLTDFYAETGMHPQGDDAAYTDTFSTLHLLGADWYRGGFRAHYLPWVSTVVARHAAHPAVFAWELGNEIKCDADHAAFLAFTDETGRAIRALDTRHLIASGMITSAWMSPSEAASFYASPYLDVVTLHEYDGTHSFDESSLANAAGKPWIVEEAGFQSGTRATEIDADIRDWIDSRGGRGYMQWGFTVVTPDNGDGDSLFGMDRLAHASDYDALFATYMSAAARIR